MSNDVILRASKPLRHTPEGALDIRRQRGAYLRRQRRSIWLDQQRVKEAFQNVHKSYLSDEDCSGEDFNVNTFVSVWS